MRGNNNIEELDRKQRRGNLYDDKDIRTSDNTLDTFITIDRQHNINNNIDKNNVNDDFKKLLFEEVFLSGSMPAVTRLLTEQFIDYYEGNYKDYKLIPYVILFFIDVVLRGIAQVFLCNHPISGIFILIGIGASA